MVTSIHTEQLNLEILQEKCSHDQKMFSYIKIIVSMADNFCLFLLNSADHVLPSLWLFSVEKNLSR